MMTREQALETLVAGYIYLINNHGVPDDAKALPTAAKTWAKGIFPQDTNQIPAINEAFTVLFGEPWFKNYKPSPKRNN